METIEIQEQNVFEGILQYCRYIIFKEVIITRTWKKESVVEMRIERKFFHASADNARFGLLWCPECMYQEALKPVSTQTNNIA